MDGSGLKTAEARVRAMAAEALCRAIAECHPEDAAQIMAAALDDMGTTGPAAAFLGAQKQDAEFWAETAPPNELQAYCYAGLQKLGQRALGPKTRSRMIVALWNAMRDEEKQKFLALTTGAK